MLYANMAMYPVTRHVTHGAAPAMNPLTASGLSLNQVNHRRKEVRRALEHLTFDTIRLLREEV